MPADNTFLNEQGISITRIQVIVSGKSYFFSRIAQASIERTRPEPGFFSFFKKHTPTYRLMISESAAATPQFIFETQDPELAQRIGEAIGKAAAANHGNVQKR